LAAVGNRAIVAEYFSDSLGMVDLLRPRGPKASTLALSPQIPMSQLRKGEFLFHDGEVCFQKWQSCATCHPDARVDALNWDLLNDGMGTPKNTKNMLLAHRTPPTSMVGARENAEKSVRSGFRYIEFNVLPEEDARAVDVYLQSLQPVPSPRLVQGNFSESALRGKDIFEKAQCSTCHPAPLFTDLNPYDVGTGTGIEEGKAFDTPTLIECWRTAPYLYDGRAATMREVFQWHGEVKGLNQQEMEDLIEYVLSL
jgi:cytochrome c peroxidase